MLHLRAGDYRLALDPGRGGSIARFAWRGEDLMRPTCGPSIFDTACFPLVPFSNRIAQGRFRFAGKSVRLAPNFPGSDHPHALHGFGWLAQWRVDRAEAASARLVHDYPGGDWPWAYRAVQGFTLDAREGLGIELSLTNLSSGSMPAGLGLHPYFPRRADTRYRGLHRAEWTTTAQGLPLALDRRDHARDWWQGLPAGARQVDTAYLARQGPLEIVWPDRALALAMAPDDSLAVTVVYTPAGEDFLCVEPVSHGTDAINRPGAEDGMACLAPGETMACAVSFKARALE